MYSGDEFYSDEITSGLDPADRVQAKPTARRAAEVIEDAHIERFGFLTTPELAMIAADRAYRLTLVLVRCGASRFITPADQAKHLIDIITREGTDYVRDVSLYRAQTGTDLEL